MAFSHPAVCNDERGDSQSRASAVLPSTGAGVEEVQRLGFASSPPRDLGPRAAAHPTIAIDQMHQAPRVRLRAELPRTPQACGEAAHPLTASARNAAVFQMGHAEHVQQMRLCAELPCGQPMRTNAAAVATAAAAHPLTPPHVIQSWPQGPTRVVQVQEAQIHREIHRAPQQTPQLQSRHIWMTSPKAVSPYVSHSTPGQVQVPVEAGPLLQVSGGIGASVGVAPPTSSRTPSFHAVPRGTSFAIHSGAAQPALVAALPPRLCKGVSAGVAAAAPRVQSFAVHNPHVSQPTTTMMGQAHYAGQIPSRLPLRVHSFAPCTPSPPAHVHSFSVHIASVSEAQRLEAMRRAIAESGVR